LDITYLGAGGFLIRWRGHSIMTGPFYSNPGFLRAGLGLPISPDAPTIRRLLPDVHEVEAILVGHAHYDHLMDTAYVAQHLAPDAVVYGSDTARNILASLPIPVVSLEGDAGDAQHDGTWHDVAGPAIRVLALRSEHAPHWGPIKLMSGRVTTPRKTLPCNAYGWKEGQTLAYVIELVNPDGSVGLRLHYQDTASTPPFGFPPPSIGAVDVDLLCAASFANVRGYPEGILQRVRPRAVVLAHWEDFFRDAAAPPRVVRFTDGAALAHRLDATGIEWHTPYPGARVDVCPRPAASSEDTPRAAEIALPPRSLNGPSSF
jgi:L-ascorbate metabolism protein UlaG (beta-lactamase superfamily)